MFLTFCFGWISIHRSYCHCLLLLFRSYCHCLQDLQIYASLGLINIAFRTYKIYLMGFTHFCPPGLIDIASWVLQNLPYGIYTFLPSKPCCFIGLTKFTLDITCCFQDLISALLINIHIYARYTGLIDTAFRTYCHCLRVWMIRGWSVLNITYLFKIMKIPSSQNMLLPINHFLLTADSSKILTIVLPYYPKFNYLLTLPSKDTSFTINFPFLRNTSYKFISLQ